MNEVWQVGKAKITRVVEMEVTGGSRFILPDATREACRGYRWLYPHFMDDVGNLVSRNEMGEATGSRSSADRRGLREGVSSSPPP